MATQDEKTPQGSSTNALLAQILQVAQDSNSTLKASLVVQKSTADAISNLSSGLAALVKIESDSRDYLKQISDALGGGDTHVFTVKVEQLAKKLAEHLRK